jgi:hypothetical protein
LEHSAIVISSAIGFRKRDDASMMDHDNCQRNVNVLGADPSTAKAKMPLTSLVGAGIAPLC